MARAWDVPGLKPDLRFREAAGRVVLTRWREMMSFEAGTRIGDDIEFLHDMRVSSRRLRAALDAFAAAFPGRSFRRYLASVKEVTDTLGAARDLDVAIDGLCRVIEEMDPREQVGLQALVGEYRARRAAESTHITALFDRLEAEQFAVRFEAWVGKHTGVDPATLSPRPPQL